MMTTTTKADPFTIQCEWTTGSCTIGSELELHVKTLHDAGVGIEYALTLFYFSQKIPEALKLQAETLEFKFLLYRILQELIANKTLSPNEIILRALISIQHEHQN